MCTGVHPFIPVPHTAKVRMVYNEFSQVYMNVFYFENAGPWTSAGLIALNNAVLSAWTANIKAGQNHAVNLAFIESTALDGPAGLQETLVVNVLGGSAIAAAPGSITLAIKFATGLTGRSQRGRMYYIGTSDIQFVGNDYDPSAAAGILSSYRAFFASIVTAVSTVHVVVSYCTAGAWRTTGQTTPVTSYLLTDNFVDSQRRRLSGRGM